jgi:hypothetical protein
MLDNFKDGDNLNLVREENESQSYSWKGLNYTLEELQIAYKAYSKNIGKHPLQIKFEIKNAFKEAGINKSIIEISRFLELSSMTRNLILTAAVRPIKISK